MEWRYIKEEEYEWVTLMDKETLIYKLRKYTIGYLYIYKSEIEVVHKVQTTM